MRRRLTVLHHVDEVTDNVAMTCRYHRHAAGNDQR
jgi:hypothetical protein